MGFGLPMHPPGAGNGKMGGFGPTKCPTQNEVPDRGGGVCEGEVKTDRRSTPDKIDFNSGVGHRLTLKCETQTFGVWAEKPASDSQGQGREYVTTVSECSKRDGN